MAADLTFAEEYFERDIAKHEMRILREDGVYRHLRFQRPGTMCMHFDILTWPGYLCYTGDMGTYVFRRLHDMLQFFRKPETYPAFRMDRHYWAEKLEALDRGDGVERFSTEAFKAAVKDHVDQVTEDDTDWTADRKRALWQAIESDVFSSLDVDGEYGAWTALRDFKSDGFQFLDWEGSCKEYTHRFLWCCHALEWAVAAYDAQHSLKISESCATQPSEFR